MKRKANINCSQVSLLWEAEYQFNLEKDVQTHIFSTRVLGYFDRNHALDEDQYWGEGKIRDHVHTAKERRVVRSVDTHPCVPSTVGIGTWARKGRRAAKFSSLKPVCTNHEYRHIRNKHLQRQGHQRRQQKFFPC